MKKHSPFKITFRYLMVAGLLYAIWSGHPWAIKLTLTIVIFHSELIYIANRLKEEQFELMSKTATNTK